MRKEKARGEGDGMSLIRTRSNAVHNILIYWYMHCVSIYEWPGMGNKHFNSFHWLYTSIPLWKYMMMVAVMNVINCVAEWWLSLWMWSIGRLFKNLGKSWFTIVCIFSYSLFQFTFLLVYEIEAVKNHELTKIVFTICISEMTD